MTTNDVHLRPPDGCGLPSIEVPPKGPDHGEELLEVAARQRASIRQPRGETPSPKVLGANPRSRVRNEATRHSSWRLS